MSNIKLFESQQIRSIWNEGEQKWNCRQFVDSSNSKHQRATIYGN